ncbi:MAG TPA: hypothetical protein VN914_04645 [Polyangia bacterium]|nr:hypothetical protein [Polyangia bacterium]
MSPPGPLLACLLALLVGCDTRQWRPTLPPAHLAYWRVAQPAARSVGCASVDAWVSKSGKAGLGLTVELRPREPACSPRLGGATLVVAGQRVSTVPVRTGAEHHYLPFLFDNDRAWRAGVRDAHVELLLDTGGPAITATIALHQLGLQPHDGVVGQEETQAGCARVDAEVLDLREGRVVLRLHLQSAQAGCRVRFAGISSERTARTGRLDVAPPTDRWYSLPTRWVLSFALEQAVSAKQPWGKEVLVATSDGKTHPVAVGVSRPFYFRLGSP